MKRHFASEQGYTLFLTVLISLVFIVITTSLITITMNGINKNDHREDYSQATELSEKGLAHITGEINAKLQTALGTYGLPRQEFINKLESILDSYKCNNERGVRSENNETGVYDSCIIEYVNTLLDMETGEANEVRKSVTFRSTGSADGTNKEIVNIVEIGARAEPDALNYAIGSHIACEPNKGRGNNNCLDGEGNLFLHGGVQIEGDMKVDGSLITTEYGYALLGKDEWIGSVLPSILPKSAHGNQTGFKAKLVLGDKIYKFNTVPSYNSHIKRNNSLIKNNDGFDNANYKRISNLEDAFTVPPEIVKREPVRDKIVIEDQEKLYKYGESEADKVISQSVINEGDSYKESKVFADNKNCEWNYNWFGYKNWICDNIRAHQFEGNNTFKQFATDTNLSIRNTSRQFAKTTVTNGMYVGGNLTIGNPGISTKSYRNNPDYYDKIQIQGPIYVDGDLKIIGADAELNALIYVNGDVEIQYSRINGLNKNNREKGSLIVFADGQVKISNNSLYEDEPSNIRGYFYSNDIFEMFGVGSNIRIEGGISARRIVLNAIRGRAKERRFQGSQEIYGDYYEGVSEQKKRDSRIQVIYNPDIINTYSDLKKQEPIIYTVDNPKLIERAY
ncbi:hypothetical protein [Oceanobacillus chungangensis]|uniref:Uncharacterized protein n=1 Tax=Oceanobacillus chungangensis TaxID=1229152 RepID=A0A3D8Q0J9_9BACI|nr:hypothetical protein [Oceanobacillus chungangensis]RDW21572.1 hypothetical protein CWR45_01475 [Oceanobacillus chungangensis]